MAAPSHPAPPSYYPLARSQYSTSLYYPPSSTSSSNVNVIVHPAPRFRRCQRIFALGALFTRFRTPSENITCALGGVIQCYPIQN
ncbi:hypothetical protein DFH09DRAFT_1327453 [Mycena vulgaris]|nr:hypothetical protein DFH09DRAFT_1327453 [Mycena vulgaris]